MGIRKVSSSSSKSNNNSTQNEKFEGKFYLNPIFTFDIRTQLAPVNLSIEINARTSKENFANAKKYSKNENYITRCQVIFLFWNFCEKICVKIEEREVKNGVVLDKDFAETFSDFEDDFKIHFKALNYFFQRNPETAFNLRVKGISSEEEEINEASLLDEDLDLTTM